ncbi:MAG: hypothetical protein KAY44_04855 [Neisseria sp.]|nr:hypothetical protein [Neisseria sp.]
MDYTHSKNNLSALFRLAVLSVLASALHLVSLFFEWILSALFCACVVRRFQTASVGGKE